VAGTRVAIETGTKRTFASALDWPGWSRSSRDERGALEALERYAERYAVVPETAGVPFPKKVAAELEVIERQKGGAATDFGVPEMHAAVEKRPMSKPDIDRTCDLVAACWTVFDATVKKAPAELRKGPRGGGRDRDKIVEHVLGAEVAYASKLGVKLKQPDMGDRAGIAAHREALLGALRAGADGKPKRERGWPARYAARRIAWHVLDHAWEIEDRSEV